MNDLKNRGVLDDPPETIFLQFHNNHGDGVTWCVDRIHDSDTKYVLATTAQEWKHRAEEAEAHIADMTGLVLES